MCWGQPQKFSLHVIVILFCNDLQTLLLYIFFTLTCSRSCIEWGIFRELESVWMGIRCNAEMAGLTSEPEVNTLIWLHNMPKIWSIKHKVIAFWSFNEWREVNCLGLLVLTIICLIPHHWIPQQDVAWLDTTWVDTTWVDTTWVDTTFLDTVLSDIMWLDNVSLDTPRAKKRVRCSSQERLIIAWKLLRPERDGHWTFFRTWYVHFQA